jgi:hypothetical protein
VTSLNTDVISPEWTERLPAGAVRVDPPTIDFLLNVQVITCRVAYSA